MNSGWHAKLHVEEFGEQYSKEDAEYRVGVPFERCGQCEFFKNPHACEIVRGYIVQQQVCKFFDKKFDSGWPMKAAKVEDAEEEAEEADKD